MIASEGETVVECEGGEASANDRELCRMILERLDPEEDRKQSYMHQNKTVHCMSRGGIAYMAVCEGDVERKVPFMYLLRLEKETSGLLTGRTTIKDLDKGDLRQRMNRLAHEAENDKNEAAELGKEIEQVRNIMVENVERLLERGERINLLVSKTDRMNNNSLQFRRRTVAVRRSFWWKNIKLLVLLIVVCMIIAYFTAGKLNTMDWGLNTNCTLGFFCGYPLFDRCMPHHDSKAGL